MHFNFEQLLTVFVTLTESLAATVYVYVYNSDMSAYCNCITMADVITVQLLSKIQHNCIIDINNWFWLMYIILVRTTCS